MTNPRGTTHVLTVDVEDWYHDAAEGRVVGSIAPRVEDNLRHLLDLLDECDARATLFFLGEVAREIPHLVREAAARGHEIASHGERHRSVRTLLRRELEEDLRTAFARLADLVGHPVAGYRAPYFSIKADVRWPLDAVAAAGFRYDSSVLPIDRPPGLEVVTPRTPHLVREDLWEVPIAVNRYHFWNLPLLGGFALRALPHRFTVRRLSEFAREFGPAVVHLHPWELDADGPELESVPRAIRSLKRWGRASLEGKLRRLLRERSFRPVAEVFPQVLGASSRSPSGAAAATPSPSFQR